MGWTRGIYWEKKIHTGFWLGNLREETTLEDSSLDEKTKLKWTFQETGQKGHGLASSDSEQVQEAVSCEQGNDP